MKIAHAIKVHRAAGTLRARSKPPRQQQPDALRAEYATKLLRIVDKTRAALGPLIHALPRFAPVRRADAAGDEARVRALLARARADMAHALNQRDVEALAAKFAAQTATYQRIQLLKQTRAALGVDVLASDRHLPALVDAFVRENVKLIKDVPQTVMDQVGHVVLTGMQRATPHPKIAEQINERVGVGESRAKLIARDQIGKLYGQINAVRQQDLGVTRFYWRTVGDPRVREYHRNLSRGGPYSYEDPPDGMLPGEPVNCRCYAEPVFVDVLGEE